MKLLTDDKWKREPGSRTIDVGTNVAGEPMQITVGYMGDGAANTNAITLDNDITTAIASLPEMYQLLSELTSFVTDCCQTQMSAAQPIAPIGSAGFGMSDDKRSVGEAIDEAKALLWSIRKQAETIDEFRK